MGLELVSFAICPFVQRAVIALKEKRVDFDITYIDLDNPPDWFKEISPFGKVPLLRIGDEVLFESAIINEYLDEVYPPALHPENPLERAKHRGWIEFGSNLLFDQLKAMMAKDEDSFQQQCEVLGGSFARLDPVISDGPYFMGERFSLLDTAYAPFFMRFEILKKHHEALEDLMPTRLSRWGQALLDRDSVKTSVVDDFEQRFVAFGKSKGSFILAKA
ncbi:glutathione S-transferase family protein [Sedimenticola selenatireducens]|uniref:glutathione transferase n=1 Tax=Sedimenticola selenatireducens TaxID=191960 RepID=A0A2N6D006_9GAMM|nr:glutathione S-transferase family protein [Sedimenticola selenatireducens]PLX63001.1 MAG: glutathione S-transferase [Sedimenticola selenatireducens]